MKKTLFAILTGLTVLSSGLTAFAALETMPDGTVFDAAYYAQNNPDVVAELGTSREALYNHYITFGRNEGRLPYEPGTVPTAEVTIPSIKAGMTPTEVLVFLEFLSAQYPEFMLTDSRPIAARNVAAVNQSDKVWSDMGINITYSYDSEGKLIGMDKPFKTIYTYDAQGRLIYGECILHCDVKYDGQGRITEIAEEDGLFRYKLKYNDSGLLISMDSASTKNRYGYDGQNNLIWQTYTSDSYNKRWDYNYDECGRLIKKTLTYTDAEHDSNNVHEYVYGYDEQGRMICKIESSSGKLSEKTDFIYE